MNEQRNQYSDPWSQLSAAYHFVIAMSCAVSQSVLLLLRRDVGFRMVQPWICLLNIAIMVTIAQMGSLTALYVGGQFATPQPMLFFALLVAGLAIYHRRHGWRLTFTKDWHSMSRGLSWLNMLLPMIPRGIMQRYVEPLLCAVVAAVLVHAGQTALGLWIGWSGFGLAVAEAMVFEHSQNATLDRYDARVEAKHAQRIDAFVQSGGKFAPPPISETGGVPVTISPELQAFFDRPTVTQAA